MKPNELDFSMLFEDSQPIEKTDNVKQPDQEGKTHVDLRATHQSIIQTYKEQNEMRRRCNIEQTNFLKAFDDDLTDYQLLDQAIKLITLILDDPAYTVALEGKITSRNKRLNLL